MYSKSGLFIESQLDIVSSVEMESPECPGDTKLLKGITAGTAIGTTVGTLRGGGALSFCTEPSWRDVTGAGLVEADFTAEPRFAFAFRAPGKDPFFTGAAAVAELNLALPAVTTAIFPQPALPPAAAATLVRLPSATRFFACCCGAAAAGPAAGLAPAAPSGTAGRLAVAVDIAEEKRRGAAGLLDIGRAGVTAVELRSVAATTTTTDLAWDL